MAFLDDLEAAIASDPARTAAAVASALGLTPESAQSVIAEGTLASKRRQAADRLAYAQQRSLEILATDDAAIAAKQASEIVPLQQARGSRAARHTTLIDELHQLEQQLSEGDADVPTVDEIDARLEATQ